MGDKRLPGVIGMDSGGSGLGDEPQPAPSQPRVDPMPIDSGDVIPLVSRTIATVTKDWEPPAPNTATLVTVGGNTLEAAGNALNAQGEWGRGGGNIRTDNIGPGNTTNLTIVMHANLIKRLPAWSGYGRASTAVKAEWDRMIAKLEIHEARHMEIAIEEANNCASDLINREIGEIAARVTHYNGEMARRQRQLDTTTESGSKEGVPYGDVTLDISIT